MQLTSRRLGIIIGLAAAAAGAEPARAENLAIAYSGIWSYRGTDLDDPTTWDGWHGERGYIDGFKIVYPPDDQRDSVPVAAYKLYRALELVCGPTSGNWCRIYAYSNGGAVVSYALSAYGSQLSDNNLVSVHTSGSNEGGSPLSEHSDEAPAFADFLVDLAARLLYGGSLCPLAYNSGPSDFRGAWNHNATAGLSFYMRGGYKFPLWLAWSGWATSVMTAAGPNDGLIPFDSSYGYNSASYAKTTGCDGGKYTNHFASGSCAGYAMDHGEICGSWNTTAWPVPGRVEAERIDPGTPGYAYLDTTPGNECEQHWINQGLVPPSTDADVCPMQLAWVEPGEWVKYTLDVTQTGTYTLLFRLANCHSWAKSFRVRTAKALPSYYGSTSYTVDVPAGGGCGDWSWKGIDVYLSQGTYTITLEFDDPAINIDYFELFAQ